MKQFIKHYWPLLAITLAGLLLRLYHLTGISLWHDEAFSVLLIRYPWGEMMHRIGLDVHPPMYYIFLRLWHYGFGDSMWSLRGFSLVFSVATIPAAYALIKTALKNSRTALLAALLTTVNPFIILYVTEARMYTMGAFFAVLAAYGLVKAMQLQREYYDDKKAGEHNTPFQRDLRRRFTLNYLLFTVSAIIIIYTHYFLLFTAASIGFYGLIYHWHAYKDNLKHYGWLIASFIIIGLSYLPWLKTFLFQFKQVSGGYWIPPMDRWSIPNTLWNLFLGYDTANHWLLLLGAIITIYIVYRVIRYVNNFEKWLVLLSVAAPFAGAIAFLILAHLRGQAVSVYQIRYFLFGATFFSMMLALWLERTRPKILANVLIVALCAINLLAFVNYWHNTDTANHPGMAGAASFLAKNVEPDQKLYVGSSFEFFNFKYYNRTPVTPLLYSGGITDIAQLPHYAGTAILTDADLLPDFKAATHRGDTVWLLWTTGFGGSKPQVPTNWTQIDEKGFAEIRPYLGTWIVVTEYKVN